MLYGPAFETPNGDKSAKLVADDVDSLCDVFQEEVQNSQMAKL
jgi:hypothetical protein